MSTYTLKGVNSDATTHTTNPDLEVTMSNFTATTNASDAAEAVAKVTKYVGKVDGFSVTGRVAVRSERHLLWDVEIADEGGDRNDLWVVLTSYGMNPSKSLGSGWQTVAGVGA